MSKPEKLLDRGRIPAGLGKKFARGITPPPCDCCCSGAEVDGAGTTWTDPGLVTKIPGAGLSFSSDPPIVLVFGFAFRAIEPGPIDILRACWPGFTIMLGTRGGEPIIDAFEVAFGGAVARICGGGSTLHIMGTGPSAALKSTSVRPYIVGPRGSCGGCGGCPGRGGC